MLATPASPRLQQVRQQLDDLDALLERMLALPLDTPPPSGSRLKLHSDPLTLTLDQAAQSPAPVAATPAVPQPEVKPEPVEEPPTIVAFRREEVPPAYIPEEKPRQADAQEVLPPVDPFPSAQEVQTERETSGNAPPAPSQQVHEPPVTSGQVAYPESAAFASIEEKPATVPAPPSWGLSPLLALNAAFDWAVEKGGWVSRWARTPLGKQLFGGTGLLLCAAAAALALGRWLGLTWR